jgi:hypothetical protein
MTQMPGGQPDQKFQNLKGFKNDWNLFQANENGCEGYYSSVSIKFIGIEMYGWKN